MGEQGAADRRVLQFRMKKKYRLKRPGLQIILLIILYTNESRESYNLQCRANFDSDREDTLEYENMYK